MLTHATPIDAGLEVTLWHTGYDDDTGRRTAGASEIGVTTVDCPRELRRIQDETDDLESWMVAENPSTDRMMRRARALLDQIAELQRVCAKEDVTAELALVGDVVCTHHARVLQHAGSDFTVVPLPDMADELVRRFAPVIAAGANAMALDVECFDAGEFAEPFNRYIDAYTQSVNDDGVVIDYPFWRLLWYWLAQTVNEIRSYSQQLDIEPQVSPSLERLGGALYDVYWPIAQEICREWGDQTPFVDLATAGAYSNRPVAPPLDSLIVAQASMSRQEILDAIQYCGSDVTLEVYEPIGTVLSTHTLGEGTPPGSIQTELALRGVPADAMLGFSGLLRSLRCSPPGGSAFLSDDELVFRVGSTEIRRLPMPISGNFFSTPLDIPVSQLLDASSADRSATLSIHRVGEMCGGWYLGAPVAGVNDVKLFEVQVESGSQGSVVFHHLQYLCKYEGLDTRDDPKTYGEDLVFETDVSFDRRSIMAEVSDDQLIVDAAAAMSFEWEGTPAALTNMAGHGTTTATLNGGYWVTTQWSMRWEIEPTSPVMLEVTLSDVVADFPYANCVADVRIPGSSSAIGHWERKEGTHVVRLEPARYWLAISAISVLGLGREFEGPARSEMDWQVTFSQPE